jgi:rhodanese-related sulfurtransferase
MNLKRILPSEFNSLSKTNIQLLVVDIREDYEIQIDGKLNGSIHIPLGDLINRLNELPVDRQIIFHCNSGSRSENILNFLIMNGLYKDNYFNLEGGFKAISK